MSDLTISLDYTLWTAAALVMLLAGGLWERRHRRALQRLQGTVTAQTESLAALERDLAALLSCSRGVAERVTKSEAQQRRLQTELDKLHRADDNQLAITHAMKLLNSGVDLKNVTELCELSEGEVEILQNLARHRQAA